MGFVCKGLDMMLWGLGRATSFYNPGSVVQNFKLESYSSDSVYATLVSDHIKQK